MNPIENWYVMVLKVMQRENMQASSYFKTRHFLVQWPVVPKGPLVPDWEPLVKWHVHLGAYIFSPQVLIFLLSVLKVFILKKKQH